MIMMTVSIPTIGARPQKVVFQREYILSNDDFASFCPRVFFLSMCAAPPAKKVKVAKRDDAHEILIQVGSGHIQDTL